jgi:hypothetical protein
MPAFACYNHLQRMLDSMLSDQHPSIEVKRRLL